MGIASISGASRDFLIQPGVQHSAEAKQSAKVKSVVAEATQTVRQQQNAGSANHSGVLSKIGDALKAASKVVLNTVHRVNRDIDALVKKSPVLSFAFGLTAAVAGMGLLMGGAAPLGIPLALGGFVLAAKAFDPFLRTTKQFLLNKKPVDRQATSLLQGGNSSALQSSTARKID